MTNLPKAAQEILALPGVESLEREPDGWCCHLRYGWTTDALSGGGTIVDSNLRTIRAFVRGAYVMPVAAEPEPEPAPITPGQFTDAWLRYQEALARDRAEAQAQAQALAQAVAQALPPQGPRFGATSEPAPHPCSAEGVAEAACQALAELIAEDEPQARPVLPGEALPPAPPAQAGPAPQLPTIRPPFTPAELRAQAAELETEALQALQALAETPALASSAEDVRSMARQLTCRATELRAVAARRAAQAEAQALAQAWQARPATAADLPPAERPAWMLAPWAGRPQLELRAWHPHCAS